MWHHYNQIEEEKGNEDFNEEREFEHSEDGF